MKFNKPALPVTFLYFGLSFCTSSTGKPFSPPIELSAAEEYLLTFKSDTQIKSVKGLSKNKINLNILSNENNLVVFESQQIPFTKRFKQSNVSFEERLKELSSLSQQNGLQTIMKENPGLNSSVFEWATFEEKFNLNANECIFFEFRLRKKKGTLYQIWAIKYNSVRLVSPLHNSLINFMNQNNKAGL